MLVGPTGSDRAQFLFRLDQYVGRAKHALKVRAVSAVRPGHASGSTDLA